MRCCHCSSGGYIVFKECRCGFFIYKFFFPIILISYVYFNAAAVASEVHKDRVQLKLNPRLCTLSKDEPRCKALVRISWTSEAKQSLCLKVVNRPDVNHCWKQNSQGNFGIQLAFKNDLTVELRDSRTQSLVASKTISIVREGEYRHRRRHPWDLFQ
jgi:hypothetical protein